MPTNSASPRRLHALVPCAGRGARAGMTLAKQYVVVAGRPVLAHTLAALAGVPRLATILVVLAPDDADYERAMGEFVDARVIAARCGGATRAASVRAGLAELARRGARADDWVLVHDAARCLVRAESIDALIDGCIDDAVGGLLAVRAADTLKEAKDGRVVATVSRERIWQAQTPQMFRLGMLADALARSGDVTDDAGAIEAMGLAPRLVEGAADNLKVTHANDFAIASALLERAR